MRVVPALPLLALTLLATPAVAQVFERVPTPNPDATFNLLTGIDGVSPRDAWAVGAYGPTGGEPLLLHWDGAEWTQAAAPERSEQLDVRLNAVDALSASDAFAVGTLSHFGRPDAYVLRWDGFEWREAALPDIPAGPPDSRELSLEDVFAVSPADVWMVGWRGGDGIVAGQDALPLALHWDGAALTHVPMPPVSPRFHRLEAVHGSASDDVWAVGMYKNGPGQSDPLVYRWDGRAWAEVPTPFAGRSAELYDVAVLAPDDVWIAGGGAFGGGPLVAHWDGRVWTEHVVPDAGSLAALAPDDIYLFGGPVQHWDGRAWGTVDPLADLAGPAFRGSATVVLPDGHLWAAGRTVEHSGSLRTLVLRSVSPVRAAISPTAVEGPVPAADDVVVSALAPNPAAGPAAFTVTLRQPEHVRVEVFDARGRAVAVLRDGAMAAGTHRLVLDAAAFAPGLYLVRTTAARGGAVTCPVVLVR